MSSGEGRHARQLLIPDWDQSRISAATIVLAGMGALGNEVAKNLALLGVGRLVVCDRDTVATSNLSRSVLFAPDDVGAPKAVAAARALGRLAPSTAVSARVGELSNAVGVGELADADAVLGCLDSRHARLSLLGRCARAGAPLIDGGTHPWGGEVRVRLSPDEACYCCSLTPGQRAEADAPLSCDPAGAPQPASIISTALVAGWMTTAATQLLLGRPVGWRFLQIEALSGRTAPITVRRDDGCRFHQRPDSVDQLELGGSATVRELLDTLPEDSEPLVWTMFPVPGICYHCGHESVPANIRGGSLVSCPNCREIVHLDLTQRLREAPPDATLSELGVAPEEIIPVRSSSGGYRWLRIAA